MFFTPWTLPLTLLLTLSTTFAAPITPLAPVHRVLRRAPAGGYIVKFKPGVIAADNRRTWLDNQLRKAGAPPLATEDEQTLKMGWDNRVFDGFAATISPDAVESMRASGDVEYIAEGERYARSRRFDMLIISFVDGETWLTEFVTQ